MALFKPAQPNYFSRFARRFPWRLTVLVVFSGVLGTTAWIASPSSPDLEGMKSGDWPVGRFIVSEVADTRLPARADPIMLKSSELGFSLYREMDFRTVDSAVTVRPAPAA